MNNKQALIWATKELEKNKIKSANLDAEVLLCDVIKKNKTFLYTYSDYIINKNKINKFKKYISRRAASEPVAYIIKNKKFFNLDFYVNKNALIPRPETEILVEEVLKIIKNNNKINNILEIGTGSGCIIISLTKNIKNKNIKFLATDISEKILNIAKKNAKNNNIKNIKFIKSNLLKNTNINKLKKYILITNLPYLPEKNKYNLKHEPAKALYSGKDGMDLYEKLFLEIKKSKNKPKYILLEFADQQTKKLKKIIKNILPDYKIKIKKDLAGLNRILILNKIII